VLQEPDEQLLQLEEDALMRLEPPPMPKPEMSFRTSADPHSSQTTTPPFPGETRHSNLFPHILQAYSYIGMRIYLTRAMASISTFTSRGNRATWTAARAGFGALKNSA